MSLRKRLPSRSREQNPPEQCKTGLAPTASGPCGRKMSGNGDYGAVREEVFGEARERARKLASEGLLAREIERRLDARLTATERELFRGIVRQEVAAAHSPPRRARRGSITDLQPSAPHAGGLARPAPGERWKEAMRRAWRHLDHTRRRGVLAVAPVALAAMVVAVLLGSVLTTGGHRRGATPADTGAVAKARSVPTSSAQTRAPANGTRRPVTPAHKREPPAGPATVGKR